MYTFWNSLSCLIACICNAVVITPILMPIFLEFFPQAGVWRNWQEFVLCSLFITSLCGFAGLLLGLIPFTRPLIVRRIFKGYELSPAQKEKVDAAVLLISERSGQDLHGRFHFSVSVEPQYNACAYGTNEICITDALLRDFEVRPLAGILAHEMGHHAHGDTFTGMFFLSLYSISYVCEYILQLIALLLMSLSKIPFIGLITLAYGLILKLILWLSHLVLDLPGKYLSLFCNRQKEYGADAYAAELGVGRELIEGLQILQNCGGGHISWFQSLFGTHPRLETRIEHLEQMLPASSSAAPEDPATANEPLPASSDSSSPQTDPQSISEQIEPKHEANSSAVLPPAAQETAEPPQVPDPSPGQAEQNDRTDTAARRPYRAPTRRDEKHSSDWKLQEQAAVVAWEKANRIPKISYGSEKQIDWARALRKKSIERARSDLSNYPPETVLPFIDWLKGQRSARYWIDRKNNTSADFWQEWQVREDR